MKKKLIAFAVLAIVIIIVVGYVAVFFYSAPDISGVAIESTEPSWNMVPSGRYERWYSFKVSLSIEINNPTAYKVAMTRTISKQTNIPITILQTSSWLLTASTLILLWCMSALFRQAIRIQSRLCISIVTTLTNCAGKFTRGNCQP